MNTTGRSYQSETASPGKIFFILAVLMLSWVSLFQCGTTPSPDAPRQVPGGNGEKTWKRSAYETVTLSDFRANPLFLEQIDFSNIDYPRLHAVIYYATNEIRAGRGLSYLSYREELERAAFQHAKRMVEKKFFSHTDGTDPARRTPNDRGLLAGIANPSIAENIAEGFGITYTGGSRVYFRERRGAFSSTSNGPLLPPHTYLSCADDLLKIWMESPGHRANILSRNPLALGCGAYYFTDNDFNGMPKFKAVQNFQWFKQIEKGPVTDQSP